MGRYTFLRDIAKGPFGPLYELRAEADASGLGGLARLVTLPDVLPPEVEQSIAETAWESMELRHDFILSVADVVFGTGWVTLIHDYAEGTLLRSLQRRAQERQSAFPVSIALRVVLDMLEGLDRNHGVCESTGIVWNPGGVAATSLYVCGDGRTRLLDGQLMATLIRAKPMREHATSLDCVAPELTDPDKQPDERADVFAAGAVLWELLTGHELTLDSTVAHGQRPRPRLPSVSLTAPKGAAIPLGVTQAVRAALELDPAKRPSTRSELRSLLSKAAEAATYEKLIDFVDALLHRESTLFRLTLDPAPKLSEKLRSERPKPPRLNRDFELSKRSRAAQGPALAKLQPRAAPPPKPNLSAPRAVEGPVVSKALSHRTLVGISPGALLVNQPASPTAVAEESILELEPETAKVVELSLVQEASLDASDTDETVLMLKASPQPVPTVAHEVQRDEPAVHEISLTPSIDLQSLVSSALDVPATHPASLTPSVDSKGPASGAPIVQLRLRTIVIGLLAAVIIAVGSTIITLRLFWNKPLSAAASPGAAKPSASSAPIAVPPLPQAAAQNQQPQATPSSVASSEPLPGASASAQPAATAASASASVISSGQVAPNVTLHKRKRQYTPHGL